MAHVRRVDQGKRVAARVQTELAKEARDARMIAGLSQRQVAAAAGLSQPKISRIERAQSSTLRIEDLARHFAVLGLTVSVRVYPLGSPVRDQAQLQLIARLRERVGAAYSFSTEVPVAGRADLRAWDVRLDGPVSIGIDAETRLHDMQALQRRQELKWRDSNVERTLLLVSRTHHNRRVLREHREALRSTYPLETRSVVAALQAGIDPGAGGLLVL